MSDADDEKIAALGDRIAKVAHEKAESLEALRKAYQTISPDVIELVHLVAPTKKVAPVIRQAFCPMVKAPWLQIGEKITNPYYGSEMLRCGKVTETIQTRDQDKQ